MTGMSKKKSLTKSSANEFDTAVDAWLDTFGDDDFSLDAPAGDLIDAAFKLPREYRRFFTLDDEKSLEGNLAVELVEGVDAVFDSPTPDEIRAEARQQFSRGKTILKGMSEKEFNKVLKDNDFYDDNDPYYIESLYKEYCKDEEFIKAFNNWTYRGETGEEKFYRAFKHANRPNSKRNLIIFCYGPKRSGKSKVIRACVEHGNEITGYNARWHMDPDAPDLFKNHVFEVFKDQQRAFLDDYEAYTYPEAKMMIPRMARQNWLIVDEMPDQRDEGSERIKKDIDTFLKVSSGKEGINVALLNQYYVFIKNVQIVIQILFIDTKHFRTMCRIQTQTKVGDKVILSTSSIIIVDVSKEDPEIEAWYESINDRKKKGVQEDGGTSMQDVDIQKVKIITDEYHEITQDVKDIIGDPAGSVGALNAWVKSEKSLKQIAGDPCRTSLVALAYNKIDEDRGKASGDTGSQPKRGEVIHLDPGDIFTFDVTRALREYEKSTDTKVKDKKEKADMYRLFYRVDLSERDTQMISDLKIKEPKFAATNEMTQQLVARLISTKNNKDISQQTVAKYLPQVYTWLFEGHGVGDQWEEWVDDWYNTHKKDPAEICTHDGRTGYFDERIEREDEVIVIAAKCMTADAREKSYSPTDLDPEIKESNKWHSEHSDWNVEMWVDFYCTRNNTRQVKPYDYLNPGSIKFDTGL